MAFGAWYQRSTYQEVPTKYLRSTYQAIEQSTWCFDICWTANKIHVCTSTVRTLMVSYLQERALTGKKLPLLSEKLTLLGIMGVRFRNPLKRFKKTLLRCSRGFRQAFNWASMMPRAASLSKSCAPDRIAVITGTHREIFWKSYQINPKSDCIYHFPVNLEQQTDGCIRLLF